MSDSEFDSSINHGNPVPSASVPSASFPSAPISSATVPSTGADINHSETLNRNTKYRTDRLYRLHPTSLLFDVLAQLRAIIFPAILALLGVARGDTFWLYLSMIFIGPTLLISLFRYFTLSYQIDGGQLVVKHGLIFRNVRTVPVDRIQNIDFVQNLLHRMLGVAEVRVETAAGSEPEATLRVLSLEQVERLRAEVFHLREAPANQHTEDASLVNALDGLLTNDPALAEFTSVGTSTTGMTNAGRFPVSTPAQVGHEVLKIPTRWLVLAGLASDRGMLLIGVIWATAWEMDLFKRADLFNKIEDFFPKNLDKWLIAGGLLLGFLVLFISLRVLSAIWYVLRFSGYRLERRNNDLRVSCGLTTKVHATVPRARIQFISIHRGLMMRWFGLCSVRIETASSGTAHDDASKSVSSRWFIPVVSEELLPGVLEEIRPGVQWNESDLQFHPMAKNAVKRSMRLVTLVSLVIAAIGAYLWVPWGAASGLVALAILSLFSIRQIRSMGYARTAQGVIYRSGVLTRKTSITFFEKIQAVEVIQSPFDRRWRMSSLKVDTAAAGAADHRIDVSLLDEDFARCEHSAIVRLAAQHLLGDRSVA